VGGGRFLREGTVPIEKDCKKGKGSANPDAATTIEHIQETGEIMFVPEGWSTASCNLADFTVAVGGQCVWGECLTGTQDPR
jgi:hypothetical protein